MNTQFYLLRMRLHQCQIQQNSQRCLFPLLTRLNWRPTGFLRRMVWGIGCWRAQLHFPLFRSFGFVLHLEVMISPQPSVTKVIRHGR